MNLVADTHAVVWYFGAQHRRLSRPALRAFREAEEGIRTVYIPTVVLMEMILLEQLGRLRFSYRELRDRLAEHSGFPLEPLTAEDVDEARSVGALDDPFDRLIVGTAMRLGLALITADAAIADRSEVKTYW